MSLRSESPLGKILTRLLELAVLCSHQPSAWPAKLTTMHVFRREMGRAAVQRILNYPNTEDGCCLKTEISVSLVRRSSVQRIHADEGSAGS